MVAHEPHVLPVLILALKAAQTAWQNEGLLTSSLLVDELAAVSVGIADKTPLLDLDFIEDSATEADFNFVLTRSGKLIEIQGSAERFPLPGINMMV